MPEAVRQFFVGFVHPRTWLAAILGLTAAFIAALIASIGFGSTADTITSIANSLFGGSMGIAKAYVNDIFGGMIRPYFYFQATLAPVVALLAGGFVAGLVFGLASSKERVASKSIVGGLNIAVIYILVVLLALVFWLVGFSGFQSFGSAAWSYLNSIWIDVLISLLIVWCVSAMTAILILSLKSD